MIPVPNPRRTDPHGNAAQSLYAADAQAGKYDPEKHHDTFTPPTLSPAGRHFVELARLPLRGDFASDGERRARRIATVLLDDAPALDNAALSGLVEFAVLAATYPQTMRKLLTQDSK